MLLVFPCRFLVLTNTLFAATTICTAHVREIAFQFPPCETLLNGDKNMTKAEASAKFETVLQQTSVVGSELACIRNFLQNGFEVIPQCDLVSRSVDEEASLQYRFMKVYSPSFCVDDVFAERVIEEENGKAFCRLYARGQSCETSPVTVGWRGSVPKTVIIWSDDLDMWLTCDNVKDGGGWTVIQRRQDGSVDFFRGWEDYKRGFGSLSGEFWLGLENIRRLLALGKHRIRFDMVLNSGDEYHAVYDEFDIADESDLYRLDVGSYSGNAGDDFGYHNGDSFETVDRDLPNSNDCSETYRGGFWYHSCHKVNPNGVYGSSIYGKGLNWYTLTGYEESVSYIDMKIRLK